MPKQVVPYYSNPSIMDKKNRETYRYLHSNFKGVGVDSYTAPPAQVPENFEQLENIMPAIRGSLQHRCGYNEFAQIPLPAQQLFYLDKNNQIQAAQDLFLYGDGVTAPLQYENITIDPSFTGNTSADVSIQISWLQEGS